jgi:hypothetical protein
VLFNSELYRQLSSYSPLAALISTRIYPVVAPQDCARPYVTYQRVATDPTYLHGGADAMGNDLVQFDAFGDNPDSVRAVANEVKAALDSWSSPVVNRAFIRYDEDMYESDIKLYRVSIDAEVWSTLTAP